MIRGILFEPLDSQGKPVGVATPYMVATLNIPRLHISSSLPFLVDTGADATILHLRDALQIIGLRDLSMLKETQQLKGIGGSAEYSIVPAEIVFCHDDNSLEGFQFDLRVAKPAKSWWKPRQRNIQALQLRLPSLLGRDILSEFCLVIDYHRRQLFLDHPS